MDLLYVLIVVLTLLTVYVAAVSVPIKLHLPCFNLGCLGLTVGRFYVDVYRRSWRGRFALGVFVKTPTRRFWVTRSGINHEPRSDRATRTGGK